MTDTSLDARLTALGFHPEHTRKRTDLGSVITDWWKRDNVRVVDDDGDVLVYVFSNDVGDHGVLVWNVRLQHAPPAALDAILSVAGIAPQPRVTEADWRKQAGRDQS